MSEIEDGYDVAINDLESNKKNLDAARREITVSLPCFSLS
jgi:hypothetical protein